MVLGLGGGVGVVEVGLVAADDLGFGRHFDLLSGCSSLKWLRVWSIKLEGLESYSEGWKLWEMVMVSRGYSEFSLVFQRCDCPSINRSNTRWEGTLLLAASSFDVIVDFAPRDTSGSLFIHASCATLRL